MNFILRCPWPFVLKAPKVPTIVWRYFPTTVDHKYGTKQNLGVGLFRRQTLLELPPCWLLQEGVGQCTSSSSPSHSLGAPLASAIVVIPSLAIAASNLRRATSTQTVSCDCECPAPQVTAPAAQQMVTVNTVGADGSGDANVVSKQPGGKSKSS